MEHPAREQPVTDQGGAGLVPTGLDATLVLVRHGESTFIVEGRFQGQAETPLSDTGIQQAHLVADRLAAPHAAPALPIPAGPPVEIAHSPLRRTTQTAEAVARALTATGLAAPLRPDAGLAEIHQGAWQGLLHAEVSERYGAELAAWRRTPLESFAPGGEGLPEVQARVRASLVEILTGMAAGRSPGTIDRPQVAGYGDAPADHPWSILVGHDGVFKVALLTLFDLSLDRFWMWSMDLCGITIVELRAGRPVLRAHNLTGHLILPDRAPEQAEAAAERARSGAL
jgi:broad specificity phosphatase PhoE